MKTQLKRYPDNYGHGALEFTTQTVCTCCACRTKIEIGKQAIEEQSMDQTDVWCTDCAEVKA